jgi:CRP-like cAMP-binding protein
MTELLQRKMSQRAILSQDEMTVLSETLGSPITFDAGAMFIKEGVELDQSILLLDGFACRVKELPSGERQIAALHIPGDFVDLHSFTLKRLDHSILAITHCKVAAVPHERLREITETQPALTRALWFSTTLDAAIHREWETSLGRRSAQQRVAHLFCEMRVRLSLVGLADDTGFAFPLLQQHLADCLGLTAVHVNRVLRQLRDAKLVSFQFRRVRIPDVVALEKYCEFDPAYLYLERRDR